MSKSDTKVSHFCQHWKSILTLSMQHFDNKATTKKIKLFSKKIKNTIAGIKKSSTFATLLSNQLVW